MTCSPNSRARHLRLVTITSALVANLTGPTAYSSEPNEAQVISMRTSPTENILYVKVDNPPVNAPECGALTNWHYAIDTTHAVGRAMHIWLKLAWEREEALIFEGHAQCELDPEVEDLRRITTVAPAT